METMAAVESWNPTFLLFFVVDHPLHILCIKELCRLYLKINIDITIWHTGVCICLHLGHKFPCWDH